MTYQIGKDEHAMKRTRSRLHRLSALATSTVLLLLASTLSFTSPAAAFSLCESAGSDTDGDGYGWENQQTCLVPWETHDLLKSLSPQPFSQADGKSVDDPLHWHFGRVANLTARPLGELVDQAGTSRPSSTTSATIRTRREYSRMHQEPSGFCSRRPCRDSTSRRK